MNAISDVDVNELIKFHSEAAKATMTVWPMRSQFGLVEFDENGKVHSFRKTDIR